MTRDQEVRAVLERGVGVEVVGFERRGSIYRTSFELDEVDAELADGRWLALMFKDVGETGLADHVRAAKPEFLYDPRREIDAYTKVLAPAGMGPRVYAVDRERGWLFLERLDAVELYQVGERGTWEHVARWLARMHDGLAGQREALPTAVVHDRAFYAQWPTRALELSGPEVRAALEPIAREYEAVIDRLLAMPRTVIHGEFYASNVLVDDPLEPDRVAPVDWELCGIGPGVIDLAALTSGNWVDDDRGAIAAAYRVAAVDPGEERAFAEALDAARLHLALQWLGWSAAWSPPEEHRHDWLDEAVTSAERLDLPL